VRVTEVSEPPLVPQAHLAVGPGRCVIIE